MARQPKCQICKVEIDKEAEQWFKNSTGYFHVSCRRERGLPVTEEEIRLSKSLAPKAVKETFIETATKTVKCYFCGLAAESAKAKRAENKAFHEECYQEYLDRRELFQYCCKLWGLKAPGPVISRQAKEFRLKGLTYRGMMFSLKYFYEVKNNDRTKYKGSETIGIIPYIYDEAKIYYAELLSKQQQLAQQAPQKLEKTVVKVRPEKKKPELYDFE
jgi:hypothetical protein